MSSSGVFPSSPYQVTTNCPFGAVPMLKAKVFVEYGVTGVGGPSNWPVAEYRERYGRASVPSVLRPRHATTNPPSPR